MVRAMPSRRDTLGAPSVVNAVAAAPTARIAPMGPGVRPKRCNR